MDDNTDATRHEDVMDLVRIAKGKDATLEQQVALHLLAAIVVLREILAGNPARRGKLINISKGEWHRLLRTWL
jgi:hypothetical protein